MYFSLKETKTMIYINEFPNNNVIAKAAGAALAIRKTGYSPVIVVNEYYKEFLWRSVRHINSLMEVEFLLETYEGELIPFDKEAMLMK